MTIKIEQDFIITLHDGAKYHLSKSDAEDLLNQLNNIFGKTFSTNLDNQYVGISQPIPKFNYREVISTNEF